MEYAIIVENNSIREFREYKRKLKPNEIKHVDGLPMARPVVRLQKPEFNKQTHKLKERPIIYDDKVEVDWNVVPLSTPEKKNVLSERVHSFESENWRQVLFAMAWHLRGSLPPEVQDIINTWKQYKDELDAVKGG